MRPALLLAAIMFAAPLAAQKAAPNRGELAAVEKVFDQKFTRFSVSQPMDLLGLTRGLYLPGFGVVFTAELSLIQAPVISPFRPKITKEEALQIRAAKIKRVPEIRTLMRELLLASASSLDSVPPGEQVVLGISFIYANWEDSSGLPKSILMQAQRSQLLEVAMNRQPKTALESFVKLREE
jgi:hypothetical protein